MIKSDQVALWSPDLIDAQITKNGRLTPLLKWAGGKEQELKHILSLIPSFDVYYEPFVGGGAVFFSIQSRKKFINDKSPDLFNLYMMIAQQDEGFFRALDTLLYGWQRVSRVVDEYAVGLIKIYKAYSMDTSSLGETQSGLLEFIQHHTAEFNEMLKAFFDKDTENFIREIERNLLSKTRRMKELENRKWKLPEPDIVANIECALKSAYYMH